MIAYIFAIVYPSPLLGWDNFQVCRGVPEVAALR